MSLFVNEGFEGTGTPSGWFRGGSSNFDYSAVPLSGSQSLRCDAATGDNAELQSGGVLNHSEVWLKFLVKFESLSTAKILSFDDGSFNFNYATLYVVSGSLFIGDSSPVFQGTVDTMSAGTVYNIWMHWKKGTGSNGILEASFDVAGNPRPNSGNKFTGATNSNGTANVIILRLMPQNTTIAVYDDLQISDTDVFAVSNVSVSLTGVGASPAIGTGAVTIGSAAVTPPEPVLVAGGRKLYWLEDETVQLEGVAASPEVGLVTPIGTRTPDYLARAFPFPQPDAPQRIRRVAPKPILPTMFVYMVGVNMMPKVGTVIVKPFYEDIDEELVAIVQAIA